MKIKSTRLLLIIKVYSVNTGSVAILSFPVFRTCTPQTGKNGDFFFYRKGLQVGFFDEESNVTGLDSVY